MEENDNVGGIKKKTLMVIFGVSGFLIFIYIISLILNALLNKKTYAWPPWVGKCPDYWTTSTDSSGQTICTKSISNPNGLDTKCDPLMDKYVGDTNNIINMTNITDTDKCNWSKNCNISWENIDNKC
jgi:hypothetical protein